MYRNGKIYKIVSPSTDKIYIGSTTVNYLSKRFSVHKSHMESGYYVSSQEILKYGDASIVLIERWPCTDKDELRAREQYHIDLNKGICINKNTAQTGININALEDKPGYQKQYAQIRDTCIYCDNDFPRQNKGQHEQSTKHLANVKLMHSFLDESSSEE